MKTLRYVLCDVFTERPLAGNPLAVFTDARGLDTATMQALAREMNLSETTFVLPPERGGHARVRIFTPYRELPFAGHPVLGTAFVLGGPLERLELMLELELCVVPVRLEREGPRVSFGWMTQPEAQPLPFEHVGEVLKALGVAEPSAPAQAFDNGIQHLLVPLHSKNAVAELAPDFSALAKATTAGVCAFHFDAQACKARYFVPSAGINEDPATGSAAGAIALYLRRSGTLAVDQIVCIEQGEEIGRPSTLYARVGGEHGEPRIEVGGAARVVARGQFVI